MADCGEYPENWEAIAKAVKEAALWHCIRCGHIHSREGWRILTVHHFDLNKSNCAWWNLMALCQRCHLSIQGRVDPNTPYFFEHSDWIKPYVAGFYAKKYLGIAEMPRAEVMYRINELLSFELKA